MRTYSLQDLLDRTRREACMEFSDFIEDPEMLEKISQAYCFLVDELAKQQVHLFELKASLVTDGTNVLNLPVDLYRILAIEYNDGNCIKTLDCIGFADRNRYSNQSPYRSSGYALAYRRVGYTVQLYPPQVSANQTYTCLYMPNPPKLEDLYTLWTQTTQYDLGDTVKTSEDAIYRVIQAGTSGLVEPTVHGVVADGSVEWEYLYQYLDTPLDGIAGWEELIVLTAAIACLDKQNTDSTQLIRRQAIELQRISNSGNKMSPASHRKGDGISDCLGSSYRGY